MCPAHRTANIAEACGKEFSLNVRVVRVSPNQGKGNAIRVGMMNARGRLLLMCDADGAHDFNDLDKLITKLPASPPEVCRKNFVTW